MKKTFLWLFLILQLILFCSAEDSKEVALQSSQEILIRPLSSDLRGVSIGSEDRYRLIRKIDDDSLALSLSTGSANNLHDDEDELEDESPSNLRGSQAIVVGANRTHNCDLVFVRYDNDAFDEIIEDLRNHCDISTNIFNISEDAFAGGKFGHVWLGQSTNNEDKDYYVLKRISVEKGIDKLITARRELFFGLYLNYPGITRLQQCYIEQVGININYHTLRPDHLLYIPWLIYKYEGESLYNSIYKNNNGIIQPSSFWYALQESDFIFKSIFYQLFHILNYIQNHKVIHRDIKPENICISKDKDIFKITLIDWGSALYTNSTPYLYPYKAPSNDEITAVYAPPGVIEHGKDYEYTYQYDMWSVGILMMEMMLGHRDLYSCSPRQIIMIKKNNRLISDEDLNLECRRLIYREMCVYETSDRSARKCMDKIFSKRLELLNIYGNKALLRDVSRLHLLHLLLQTEREVEYTPLRALQHPYFRSFKGKDAIDRLYKMN